MRRRPAALLCLLVLLFFSLLTLSGSPLRPDPPGTAGAEALFDIPRSYQITGKVAETRAQESYSVVILDRPVLTFQSKDYLISRVKLICRDRCRYEPGNVLEARGAVEKIRGPENPGQTDTALQDRVRGIRFLMRSPSLTLRSAERDGFTCALAGIRSEVNRMIRAAFPDDAEDVFCAMMTGDRTGLDDSVRSLWRTGGVTHMLAISGLHLTLLGMGLYRLLRKMHLSIRGAGFAVCALMLLYTVFTGGSVSTVRAFLMFVLAVGAEMTGRTYDPPTALSVAAVLILLGNPDYLLFPGFQMSCAAMAAGCLFSGRGRPEQMLELTLIMLPFVLRAGSEMPLLSIPVNLLAVPLLPALLGLGAAGTAAEAVREAAAALAGRPLSPEAASGLGSTPAAVPGTVLLRLLHRLLGFIQSLPFASPVLGQPAVWQIVLYFALLSAWSFALWALRRSRRRFLLLLLLPPLVLTLRKPPLHGMKIIFQSVGQGDSILIETGEESTVLVDGGSSSVGSCGTRRILPCLESEGRARIDYCFVTHMDADHMNGIREMLDMIRERRTPVRVGTLVLPYLRHPDEDYLELGALAREAGARVLAVSKGDRIRTGGLWLDVLNPDPACETVPADSNGQCIVLSLRYGRFNALLTGDVSGAGERQLEDYLAAGHKRYDCLKVAHHGSKYSTPKSFLEAVRPEISVISCGAGNDYGHPHDTLLNRLKAAHTKVFRTDRQGAVILTTEGDGFSVRTFTDG